MAKKREYQTGTAPASEIEKGSIAKMLTDRAHDGWRLRVFERYFSKKHDEDAFLWILEKGEKEKKAVGKE